MQKRAYITLAVLLMVTSPNIVAECADSNTCFVKGKPILVENLNSLQARIRVLEGRVTELEDTSCPQDFVSIDNVNYSQEPNRPVKRQLGCIQIKHARYLETNKLNEKRTASMLGANENCYGSYGARLPTSSEMYISTIATTLEDQTEQEWLGDILTHKEHYANFGASVKASNSTELIKTPIRDAHYYRCWIPR
mgnify:CR=1 FL=1